MSGREVRRLQVVGKSTFAVTLPKEWVEELGWRRGTPLIVERLQDGSIRVAAATDARPGDRELIVDADALSGGVGTLVRLLVSAYIAGFDTIRVTFTSASKGIVDRARRIAESIMIGFVAVEETSNIIVFQNVADVGRIDLLGALSRQARVAYSMLRDVAFPSGSEVLSLIAERDQVVDRLYLYVARQLSLVLQGRIPVHRLGLYSQAEALHYIVASKSIERVADHAVILAGKHSGGGVVPEALSLLEEAAELFRSSSESLTRLDMQLASASAAKGEALREEIDSLLRGEPGSPRLPAYILENVKRIVGYSLDISEAAIDVAVLRGQLPRIKK